jgi:hypothetical protein
MQVKHQTLGKGFVSPMTRQRVAAIHFDPQADLLPQIRHLAGPEKGPPFSFSARLPASEEDPNPTVDGLDALQNS